MSTPVEGGWAQYFGPPASATLAVMPTIYLFEVKSDKQLGNKGRKFSSQSVKNSVRVAPTLGLTVGLQMIAQRALEKVMNKNQEPGFGAMLFTTAFVSGVTSPLLAVFNEQLRGKSISDAFKGLSFKQTAAIVTRETSFLFSLRISEPVCSAMKKSFGDHSFVEYGAAFLTGAIGSFVGNPADAALTRWQDGKKMEHARQFMWGGLTRGVAVGCFTVLYLKLNKYFQGK